MQAKPLFNGPTLARLAIALAGAFGAASSAWSIDLAQVYKEAIANDATFASARSTLVAGREKLPQGRAGLLPTVGVTANHQLIESAATGLPTTFSYASSAYTLQLSQPLFRWANWQQYEEGKLSVATAEAQFAQAKQDLIVRVAQAYFDVLAAQDSLAFVNAQKVAITEQLASAKRNFEVGTATITDTHEAQARYDLAVAQELSAQSDLDVKRTALQLIIGKPPADLSRLKDKPALPAPTPAQIESWAQSAEKQNPGVAQAQIGLEFARREIERNKAGHYPTVDANISANRTFNHGGGISVTFPATTGVVYGISLNVPLYAGGAVSSRVTEAVALEDKARNDLESARRAAAQGARQAFFGVTSGLAQVRALEQAEISSRSALDSNKLGYQVGVRINIDVLNAQQQVFSTLRDLSKARYDTIMFGLKLKSAAGQLGDEDVESVNKLLVN